MLTELCQELRNWFVREKFTGKTVILSDGTVRFSDGTDPGLVNGQYFRIIGSVFSDGVHCYPDYAMPDETFDGAVWAMAIPAPVLKLAEEISAWVDKYGGAEGVATSPFASESFGGYSYSKATFSSSGGSGAATWQAVFRARLNMWRKI